MRWGTEPEGWYVDHPYAVFLAGVNYSPLEWSLCISELVVPSIFYSVGDPSVLVTETKDPLPETEEHHYGGSRPLIGETGVGYSRFRDFDQAVRLCRQPGPLRPFLQLAGVDQDGGYQRGLPAIVYPSVIRSPLHNHIERLQLHLTAIQEQRDFA